MYRRQFLSCLAAPGCLGALACLLSGCGTLLHTERVGQPHSHQIDWKVAALDGLGMLLFFVPGVVAFAVDFYTGAIYLPRGECYPPHPFPAEGGEVPGGPMPPNSTDGALENLPAPPSPELTMLQPAGRAPRNPATPGLQATRRGHVAVSSNDVPRREAVVPSASLDLRQIRVPRHQLRPQVLQQVVSRHVGRPVSLEGQQTRLSVLRRLDCFHEQRRRHESDRGFGFAARSFIERFHAT